MKFGIWNTWSESWRMPNGDFTKHGIHAQEFGSRDDARDVIKGLYESMPEARTWKLKVQPIEMDEDFFG